MKDATKDATGAGNPLPPLLPGIASPEDLRRLPARDLERLAAEVRQLIMETVSRNGGHLASNLGVVELTIALHRVFRSPDDAILWDVGHQCYAHKILTGRQAEFAGLRRRGGASGFPKRAESPHDPVETGHASTAISYGLGLLVGREREGSKGKVVAVVGDGALTGGLALEGLNSAGHLKKRLIIILNDNAMSIGRNVGALSTYLGRLTTTRLYQVFRRSFDDTVARLPLVGGQLTRGVQRFKKVLKALLFRDTLFADLGLSYVGPIDGHDIGALVRIFRNLRHVETPVVVHVTTRKGKGYPFAEDDPTRFHGITPFSLEDGKVDEIVKPSYTDAFSDALLETAGRDRRIVGVTAAMADGTGLRSLQSQSPSRVFDVGIAEGHAVTFAAGLALAGQRPVVAVYSTFLQRSVDQVIHDVALPHLPVVLAVDRAGFVSGDGETHQGLFDMSLFGPVPGLAIIAPACRAEVEMALAWALERSGPVMMRWPKAVCGPDLPELQQELTSGRGVFVRYLQSEALIVNVGGLLPQCLAAAHLLNLRGISTDIYNLRFVKPLDRAYLKNVLGLYRFAVLVEEGTARGGVGEHVGRILGGTGWPEAFRAIGVENAFLPQGSREQLLADSGLDGAGIASVVQALCEHDGPGELRTRAARIAVT